MQPEYLEALRHPNRPTIEDVRLIDLVAHTDNRGWLTELLRCDDEHFVGFGQLYVVTNFQRNVVRAFHMHRRQDEFFFVTGGVIQFVLVDERPDSATHKTLNCFVLTSERPRALFVPRRVQHGSMALTDGAQLVAVTTEPYNRASPDEVRAPVDAYGDIWTRGGW